MLRVKFVAKVRIDVNFLRELSYLGCTRIASSLYIYIYIYNIYIYI